MSKRQSKSWSEKYKDPRWQKKRLEIMERDEFACTLCGSGEKELSVHHGYYRQGADPWDYENETLWTLCGECHEFTTASIRALRRLIGTLKPKALMGAYGLLRGPMTKHNLAAAELPSFEEAIEGGWGA